MQQKKILEKLLHLSYVLLRRGMPCELSHTNAERLVTLVSVSKAAFIYRRNHFASIKRMKIGRQYFPRKPSKIAR